MAVYGYVRTSGSQTLAADSEATQLRRIAGYSMVQDIEVTETFRDIGVSGLIPFGERPAGAALLAKMRKGDSVMATTLDRMFCDALDALKTRGTLEKEGKAVQIIELGGAAMKPWVSKLMFTVLAAVADWQTTLQDEAT